MEGIDTGTGTYGPFQDLKDNITIDEDVISGEKGTPAMVLRVDVPSTSGADVDLQVIYYQTSEVENLVGGEVYCEKNDGTASDKGIDKNGMCQDGATANSSVTDVLYTDDEKKKNEALVVRAESDGNDSEAELYLKEDGRFSGVYEGYLRLTDADGDGTPLAPKNPDNWGLDVGDATGATVSTAAVLGVGNGPVIITYRDTGGTARSFTIQIDIAPPVITVDSPTHKSRSDDEKPSFIGTINDGDSGLAADTFQLYIDNVPEGAGGASEYTVLSGLGVPHVTDATGGVGEDGIDRRLEYKGYEEEDNSKFGVIEPDNWKKESLATASAASAVQVGRS